jgi:hypothetical protein
MDQYTGADKRWNERHESAKALGINEACFDFSERVREEQVQGIEEVMYEMRAMFTHPLTQSSIMTRFAS